MRQARPDAAWHRVGLVSTFPDLDLDKDAYRIAPRCKAFSIPKGQAPSGTEGPAEADIDLPGDLKDQVLVFKYKDKIHAIDHVGLLWDIRRGGAKFLFCSNVLIRLSPCHRVGSLTSRISVSLSVLESLVPNMTGLLTFSLGRPTVANISSSCGRYSCETRPHRPRRLLSVLTRRSGYGESSGSVEILVVQGYCTYTLCIWRFSGSFGTKGWIFGDCTAECCGSLSLSLFYLN